MVSEQNSVNWEPTINNLGTIRWQETHICNFVFTGNKTISSIQSSCPCVQVEVKTEPTVKIVATWRPKKPDSGFTSSTKAITIKYLDHTREQLYLTAIIV